MCDELDDILTTSAIRCLPTQINFQLVRRINAVFRQSLRDFSPTGLLRNAIAPAASACVRVVSSGGL